MEIKKEERCGEGKGLTVKIAKRVVILILHEHVTKLQLARIQSLPREQKLNFSPAILRFTMIDYRPYLAGEERIASLEREL